jgi:2-polyprenyl-3-methyl-5-hydroxy-6-metoxy-1,4-benzoquinol methylase
VRSSDAVERRAVSHRKRLAERYWSTHYHRFEPATAAEWDRVVERIHDNFGEFFAGLPKHAPILDVPCGVGYLETYLLRHGFTNVRAVDLSEEQLQVARRRLRERELRSDASVEFVAADAFEYLQRGASYRAIAVLDFLEHLPKPEILTMLDLCHGALEPGGLLFLRVSNAENPLWAAAFYRDFTHETPFTSASLRQCLEVTGFEPLTIAYEVVPAVTPGAGLVTRLKHGLRSLVMAAVGGVLPVPRAAFAEDLIAVARRPA